MNKKIALVLASIVIIATFFRLYHLDVAPPGIYTDEAFNGNNALLALEQNDLKPFYTDNNGREGFFINIQALFIKYIGIREGWVLHLPSALFGILTVLGMYFLARELFGEENPKYPGKIIGLLSAFFLATSFWHINFSRIGFRAIMAPLLAVWGIFFVLRSMRDETPANKRTLSLFALTSGIVFGLGFNTYIAYRVLPAVICITILYFFSQKGFIRRFFLFFVGVALAVAPLVMYFVDHPGDVFGRTGQVSVFNSEQPLIGLGMNILKTVGMLNIRGDYNWRHNYAGAPQLSPIVGILFWIGLFFAYKELLSWKTGEAKILWLLPKRKDFFAFLLLLVWTLVAMLPVVISNEGLPHALRAILMIPPLLVFAAVGAYWLYTKIQKTRGATLALTLGTICVVFTIAHPYITYFHLWAKSEHVAAAFNKDFTDLGHTLNSLPTEIPKYVVVEHSNFIAQVINPFAPNFPLREGRLANQTTVFITNTQTAEAQLAKKIFYIRPGEESLIPEGALLFRTQ